MTVHYIICGSNGEKKEKAEDLVARRYEARGYQVWKNNRGEFPEEAGEELREVAREVGAPDLLIKDKDGYGFVEVKSSNGSLHLNQLKWIASYNQEYPIDVVHLDEDGVENDFRLQQVIDRVGREISSLKAERDKLKREVRDIKKEKDRIIEETWRLKNGSPEKLKRLLKNVLEMLENGES